MACVISNAGGNWNAAGTWVGGVKPTAADDVTTTATSGNVTVNENILCRSLDLNGYTGTIALGNYNITIGDSVAPVAGVCFRLAGTVTFGGSGNIVIVSSAAGTQDFYTGGYTLSKTLSIRLTNGTLRLGDNFTSTTSITLDNSSGTCTFNTNNKTLSLGGTLGGSGVGAKVYSFGSSLITSTVTSANINFVVGSYTVNNNTAVISFTGTNAALVTPDGMNWNGTSFRVQGPAGTFTISNSMTINNFSIEPTTTKTISLGGGKTLTISGEMYCIPLGGVITFSGGFTCSISKSSGTVELHQVVSASVNFTGGATWNLMTNCGVSEDGALLAGVNIIGGTNYLAPDNGSDSLGTAYGFFKVAYTGATGTCPVIGEILHGETSGSTAKVSMINPYEWSMGSGTVFVEYKSAAFVAETVHGNTGDGHLTIGADFINAAWKWITTGPTSARHGIGDINKIKKSPAPTSIGDAIWTDAPTKGFPGETALSIASSTNANPIQIHIHSHGYSNGDYVLITGHTVNLSANGIWQITYVDVDNFTLNNSLGTAVGGASGTVRRIKSKLVILDTPQTFTIDRCNKIWTGANDGTAYLYTAGKDGLYSAIVMDAATQANKKQAFFATGTLSGATLNNYSKLTFWVKNSAVISTATTYYIALCSDVAGDTIIDTFPIPAIPSTNRWLAMTISRCSPTFVEGGNLGGNLSTDVKSIALYSGATAPTNSSTFSFGNFEACTTNGLNFLSLISPSSDETGLEHGWYPIMAIVDSGRILVIDNDPNNTYTYGQGYSGDEGEFETFKRECFHTPYASSSGTLVQTAQKSGTELHRITYQGGYNDVTGDQDGETVYNGTNGFGVGIEGDQNIDYITFEKISACRYGSGFVTAISINIIIKDATVIVGNATTGITFNGADRAEVRNVLINNNGGTGINNIGGTSSKRYEQIFDTVLLKNNYGQGIIISNPGSSYTSIYATNQSSFGIIISQTSGRNKLEDIQCIKNVSGGLQITASINNIIKDLLSSKNAGPGLDFTTSSLNRIIDYTSEYNGCAVSFEGINYIHNFEDSNSSYGYDINCDDSTGGAYLMIDNYNGTGLARIYRGDGDGATYVSYIEMQVATAGGTGYEWKMNCLSIMHYPSYPLKFVIGRVHCNANKDTTIKAFFKKSHATSIAARLMCRKWQLAGLTADETDDCPDDTNRNELSITVRPTEEGVVEIEAECWNVLGHTENVIVDGTLSVTEA